ncbi:MAG: putative toxin-antitoxin system toxin component, PIN family [Pseudomonadota bacterium]
MKVVFDTNIFVSALAIPGGRAEKAVLRIIEGHDQLFISKDILDELLSVLARKFSRDMEELSRAAFNISEMAEMIKVGKRLKVFRDDPDNRVLECAVAGGADLIVTGDKEMLSLKKYQDVTIISLKHYLNS